MTIKEIIDGLKFTVDMFLFDPSTGETFTEPRNDMDKTTIDACKGAIELLEQEPCDDCVSRQAVLDLCDMNTKYKIPYEYYENEKNWVRGWDDGRIINITKLKRLPSVIPQTRWIPVSERLPEENGQYLVTVKNLTGYEQLYNNVFECEFFEKDWIFKGWKDNKVIAWMPLPQPYKAESEVEE